VVSGFAAVAGSLHFDRRVIETGRNEKREMSAMKIFSTIL
jgi:hypothetical protein